VEEAIEAAAPEITRIEIEEPAAGVIPVSALFSRLADGPSGRRGRSRHEHPGRPGVPLAVLRRVTRSRPAPPAGERCDMCATPVEPDHSHIVDLQSRT
jgi:hypothetical protein